MTSLNKRPRNSTSGSDSDSPTSKKRIADAVVDFPTATLNPQTIEKQQLNKQTLLKSYVEVSATTNGQQEFIAKKLSDFLDQQIEFVSSDTPVSSVQPIPESDHKHSIRIFSHSPHSTKTHSSLDASSSLITPLQVAGQPIPRRKRHKHRDITALAVSGDQVLTQSHLPHFTIGNQSSKADEKPSYPEQNVK